LLERILSRFTGGNILAAMAYLSDGRAPPPGTRREFNTCLFKPWIFSSFIPFLSTGQNLIFESA